MTYRYYDGVKRLKDGIASLSHDFSKVILLIIDQEAGRQFDPGYTFRHVPALESLCLRSDDIIFDAFQIQTAHESFVACRNPSLANISNALKDQSITPILLSCQWILDQVVDVVKNCFSISGILRLMQQFKTNLIKIIWSLKSFNESYVAYECINIDGSIDFSKM